MKTGKKIGIFKNRGNRSAIGIGNIAVRNQIYALNHKGKTVFHAFFCNRSVQLGRKPEALSGQGFLRMF